MNTILLDETFLQVAKHNITKAKKSIYISSFKVEMTHKRRGLQLLELFNLLIQKSQEGVDVRILTNKRDNRGHVPDSNGYALGELRKQRVDVRHLVNDRICHAKIIIVDETVAILGSHNLSVRSCHNNFEVSCLTTDIVTVKQLVDLYRRVWEGAREV